MVPSQTYTTLHQTIYLYIALPAASHPRDRPLFACTVGWCIFLRCLKPSLSSHLPYRAHLERRALGGVSFILGYSIKSESAFSVGLGFDSACFCPHDCIRGEISATRAIYERFSPMLPFYRRNLYPRAPQQRERLPLLPKFKCLSDGNFPFSKIYLKDLSQGSFIEARSYLRRGDRVSGHSPKKSHSCNHAVSQNERPRALD